MAAPFDLLAKSSQTPNAALGAQHRAQAAAAERARIMFETQSAYTNLVMAVGYGGLFGVWGFTSADMAPWMRAAVGFCLLISIGSFIAFEVFKMLISASAVIRENNLAGKSLAEITKAEAEGGAKMATLYRRWVIPTWRISVYLSIAFALAAGGLLIWTFAGKIGA